MNVLQFQKKILGLQENMMNFALTLTSDKEEARDLTQDTTLRALKNQDKFVENKNFKGWVLTIMRNIFINNYHRMVHSRVIIDKNTDLYNWEILERKEVLTPEDSYRVLEIYQAIDLLDDELKKPFTLYLSGYKYAEIAKELNMPVGTVKSRIFFSRQELQKRLRD